MPFLHDPEIRYQPDRENPWKLSSTAFSSFYLNRLAKSLRDESVYLTAKYSRATDIESHQFLKEDDEIVKRAGNDHKFDVTIDSARPRVLIHSGISAKKSTQLFRRAAMTRDLLVAGWMANKRKYAHDNRSALIGYNNVYWDISDEQVKSRAGLTSPFFEVDSSVLGAMARMPSAPLRHVLPSEARLFSREQMRWLSRSMRSCDNQMENIRYMNAAREHRKACPATTPNDSLEIGPTTAYRCWQEYPGIDKLVVTFDAFPDMRGYPNLQESVEKTWIYSTRIDKIPTLPNAREVTINKRVESIEPLLGMKNLKAVRFLEDRPAYLPGEIVRKLVDKGVDVR
jgi:hypothetical protein